MKSLIVLCVLSLAAAAFARPSETKKFPKKFDKSEHAVDAKKTEKDSSYSAYSPSKDQDAIKPPPENYERQSYADLTRRIPGYVVDPRYDAPDSALAVPAEDTYSNAEGQVMDGLVFPGEADKAESNSYTIYVDEGQFPLAAPQQSSYSILTLSQLEELMSAAESAPSAAMLPPQDTPAEFPVDSSYMAYDTPRDSSYISYDQPAPGTGESLRPPPLSQ